MRSASVTVGLDATGAATFDFVVAADCIYEPAVYDDLLRTLSAFSTPDSRILLCYEQRRRDLGPFFERFGPERGFHGCERVADSELLAEARSLAGVHQPGARAAAIPGPRPSRAATKGSEQRCGSSSPSAIRSVTRWHAPSAIWSS